MERLKTGKKVVGIKQAKKAVEENAASLVFVARDADSRLTETLIAQCREAGIGVEMVDTMKSLGEACGIEVGAAIAAVLK